MIFNYTTLDTVLEKINRLNLFKNSYQTDEVKEWAIEGLLKIGINQSKDYICVDKEIIDGKVKLPEGLEDLEDVVEKHSGYPMELIPNMDDFVDMSYKVYNGYLFTSFDTGDITIRYYGLLFNSEDKILIPDNQYFLSAIEAYLKFKIGEKLYWMRKIVSGEYQMLENNWLFYCNSAKNISNMPNEDGLQNLMRKNLQVFPNINKRKRNSRIRSDNYNIVNRTRL